MNEFEDIEKELQALQPKPPTDAFTARVADALGDSGDVSFRRISSELHKPRKKVEKTVILSSTCPCPRRLFGLDVFYPALSFLLDFTRPG